MISSLKELFSYRELLVSLAKKDLKVRYKNSALGFLWSLLNPLLMMLILSFVFSLIVKFGIKDFPVFLLIGLLPWNYFNMALGSATGAVIANSGLVKKVYFPREILPMSAVLAELVNYLIALCLLLIFLGFRGYLHPQFLPLLIIVIFLQTIITIGLAMFFAGINVYFRDIQYVLNVILMFMFYATPILYTIQMVENASYIRAHQWLLLLYKANPVTDLVVIYRGLLYEGVLPSWTYFAYIVGFAVVSFIGGYAVFRRLAPAFAEEM